MFTPEVGGSFSVPWPLFLLSIIVHKLSRLFIVFSSLETVTLYLHLRGKKVKQPIYICGLARSGTTILLQTLGRHPAVGTHQYLHMPIPFLPFWWYAIASLAVLKDKEPVERVHKDGIKVTHTSPEAVEETFWIAYFKGLHDETRSNVMDAGTGHKHFERFYKNHIRKLLYSQKKERYLAKNNYNITRMEYILRFFPDARFLITIRNPINHIASFMKQNEIFDKMEHGLPRDFKMISLIGHSEFGRHHTVINTGDSGKVKKIRQLWKEGRPVDGLAEYWAETYQYIAGIIESNLDSAGAFLVVPYEQLCDDAENMMNRILDHLALTEGASEGLLEQMAAVFTAPDYYSPDFTEDEIERIIGITAPVAAKFGYLIKEGKFVCCRNTITYPAN